MEEYSVLMSVYERENPVFFRDSIESMRKQSLPFSDFVLVCDGPLGEELEEVIRWAEGSDWRALSVYPPPGKQGTWKGACRGDYTLQV